MTSCLYIMITIYKAIKPKYTRNRAKGKKIKWNSKLQQWWIQGRGHPLFLDQTEARRAEEIFLETLPPSLSQDLDVQAPPPPVLCHGLDLALYKL